MAINQAAVSRKDTLDNHVIDKIAELFEQHTALCGSSSEEREELIEAAEQYVFDRQFDMTYTDRMVNNLLQGMQANVELSGSSKIDQWAEIKAKVAEKLA